jgi:hypothetical protein
MVTHAPPLHRTAIHFVIFQFALVNRLIRTLSRKLRLIFFYQRGKVIRFFAEPQQFQHYRPKVFVGIPHITSVEEAGNPDKAAARIDKLRNTIDALLNSFSHCEIVISVNTLPNRNIVHYLPEYQQDIVRIQQEPDWDPMFIGFRIQDEFFQHVDAFDWFLFIEDDIILHDSYLLEKLNTFNRYCGDEQAVLLPNRYEMWQGSKYYIDLTIEDGLTWDRLSVVEINGVKYAECSNPHSGFYCLSQAQMKQWMRSGRSWKNQNIMVGPLESAATFSLLECFSLYKPHPSNLYFLEVRHYDTKYSRMYPESSPYILSATPATPAAGTPYSPFQGCEVQ